MSPMMNLKVVCVQHEMAESVYYYEDNSNEDEDKPEMVKVDFHGKSSLSSSFLVILSMLRPALGPCVLVDPTASRCVLSASMSAPGLTVRLVGQVPAGQAGGDDVARVTSWQGI